MPVPGGTVTLEVQYYNGNGDLFTPADPRVDIIDSLSVTRLTNAVVTMIGTGIGEYDYGPIPATPLGLWHGHFTGTDPIGTRVVTDGVTTSGSPNVTFATAAVTLVDVGNPISGTGIPAATTILSVQSATAATLSANATATATGVALTITSESKGDDFFEVTAGLTVTQQIRYLEVASG